MSDSFGRKFSLEFVMSKLKEEDVYSPNSILAFLKRERMFDGMDEKSAQAACQRLLDALWQYAIKCRFPKNGDAMVDVKGNAEPGWYGARWKQGEEEVERVFDEDEQNFLTPKSYWGIDELLSQKGVFFLKDVKNILGVDPVAIKKRAQAVEARGQSAWQVMGARKIFNHWMLRMKVFSDYYRKHFVSRVRRVDPEWDGNRLLEQKGIFLLSEVCKRIPFSLHQLRHQAKKNPLSRQEFGIWKDEDVGMYVVDMEVFAPWVRGLWGDFD